MATAENHLRLTDGSAKPIVIALHCSGATGAEWRQLGQDLAGRFTLIAPDLIGCGKTAHWPGAHAFKLSDEAERIVQMIDAADKPVHLVGHSYGGCVALRAAIERPSHVASLTLYEPVALHVLRIMGPDGKKSLDGILAIAGNVNRFVLSGDYEGAAKFFFEYWNGTGSWSTIRREARDEFVRYIPKVCLEFSAAANERVPLHAYRALQFPALLLQGEHAPEPTRLIVWQLARAIRFATMQTVYGAGHMGPYSHPAVVGALIADWIARAVPGGVSAKINATCAA